MRALTENAKTGFFDRGNGSQVVDAGDFRHRTFLWQSIPKLTAKFSSIAFNYLCNSHFDNAALFVSGELFGGFNVLANGNTDVGQRFFFRDALRPAAGQTGARNAATFLGLMQNDSIRDHRWDDTPNAKA